MPLAIDSTTWVSPNYNKLPDGRPLIITPQGVLIHSDEGTRHSSLPLLCNPKPGQAAVYTAISVPPHIQMERQRLRRELGMVESVIASPLGAEIGNDLGEGGRFVAYIELMRQGDRTTLEAVARLAERFEDFIEEQFKPSERYSMLWRRWGTIALVILVVVVVTIAGFVLFWAGRMSGGALIQDILWRR